MYIYRHTNIHGGSLEFGYPKMDSLQWKTNIKLMTTGGTPRILVPQNGFFTMENQHKMDDNLGVPSSLETLIPR